MGDPLSVIAAILSAIHVAKKTSQFISSIRGAPDCVRAVHNDLSPLQTCLETLHRHITNPQFSQCESTEKVLGMVETPLKFCAQNCKRLEQLIAPWVKEESSSAVRAWRHLTFGFRESDIREVQRELATHKSTLEIAIGMANFIIATVSQGLLKRVDRRVERIHNKLGLQAFSRTPTMTLQEAAAASNTQLPPTASLEIPTHHSGSSPPKSDSSSLTTPRKRKRKHGHRPEEEHEKPKLSRLEIPTDTRRHRHSSPSSTTSNSSTWSRMSSPMPTRIGGPIFHIKFGD